MRKPENYYNDTERYIDKIESAWAKASLYFRTENHFGHPAGSERARGLLAIHEQLEVYRRRFEGGDTLSLLHAVSVCAEENLPLPTWLAIKYREEFNSFLSLDGPTSLDVIFHSPNLPTNTSKKTATARQDWQLGTSIYSALWGVAMADTEITTLNGALKAALKKNDFGVKKSKAWTLFTMIEKNQVEFLGGQSLSRYLAKRQKP